MADAGLFCLTTETGNVMQRTERSRQKWQVDGNGQHSSTMGSGSHSMLLSTKNGEIQVFQAQ